MGADESNLFHQHLMFNSSQGEVGPLSVKYEKLPVVKLKRYWLRCNYDAQRLDQ